MPSSSSPALHGEEEDLPALCDMVPDDNLDDVFADGCLSFYATDDSILQFFSDFVWEETTSTLSKATPSKARQQDQPVCRHGSGNEVKIVKQVPVNEETTTTPPSPSKVQQQ